MNTDSSTYPTIYRATPNALQVDITPAVTTALAQYR